MPIFNTEEFKYIIAFVAIVVIIYINSLINARARKKEYLWQREVLAEEERQRELKVERDAYENAYVTLDNKFLIGLASKGRIFLFNGMPGDGKTLSMDMFGKWLYDRQEWLDKKNARRDKYMRPDYLKQKKKLFDGELLNVYDNLGMTLGKLKTQDVLPAITLLKEALQNAILILDEAGHYFPKEKYFELLRTKDLKLKAEYDRLVEFVRFIRHYINGYFLMSEQDEDNIFIGVRRTGYTRVRALGTQVYLTPKGKSILAFKNCINTAVPALFFKPIQTVLGERTLFGKLKAFGKLILPNWLNGYIYYEKKEAIDETVREVHTEYKVKWEINKKYQYMIFNNSNLFKYETRNRRKEYPRKFNNKGEAVGV